ncbi:MAG: hypothetical protein HYR94_16035 [Chloroflexi bacterium]|nr:hypothetical protein [Chloroflexota bacterium]
MNILNHQRTVVGLFSNEANIEQVLNNLQDSGFYDRKETEVILIDQNYLIQTLAEAPYLKITETSHGGRDASAILGAADARLPLASAETFSASNIIDTLTDMGIENEEAAYFALQVTRGNPLLAIRTNQEHAEEVLRIVEKADARGYKF